MKVIRMIKTMSGPAGTYPTGMQRTVDDVTAAMLIGAEAATLVQNIVADGEPVEPSPDGEPVEPEAATVDPIVETADAPIKARRKKAV